MIIPYRNKAWTSYWILPVEVKIFECGFVVNISFIKGSVFPIFEYFVPVIGKRNIIISEYWINDES